LRTLAFAISTALSRINSVEKGTKTLVVVIVALLLAMALPACGGGDDDSSSSSATESAERAESNGASADKDASGGGPQGSEKGGGDGAGATGGSPSHSSADADRKGGSNGGVGNTASNADAHNDSGGGSAPLVVEGTDNSIQEFGGAAEGSQFNEVAAVAHAYLDARAAEDWVTVCGYVFNSVAASYERLASEAGLEDASCAATAKALSGSGQQRWRDEAAGADVRSVRVDGESAFAIYVFNGEGYALPMKAEGGAWKLFNISPTPLPDSYR
jgi:hypothetical protein